MDGHGWVEGGIVPRANGQIFIAPIIDASQIIIYAVDPATVGQYTGLNDRNGKRIFDGDVVEYGGGKHKVVFVSNPHAYFGLDMIQEFGEIWPFSHSVPAGIMTVIGNIHDNPELME